MLKRINNVTYQVSDPAHSALQLSQYFGYQRIAEQPIEKWLATAWGAPAILGRNTVLLAPTSGEPCYIRFVEGLKTSDYEPLLTFGWNAAELHVQDVHTLIGELQHSPYEVIGGPRDLLNDGSCIALQVKGPCDEVFYLTQIAGDELPLIYGAASCAVDRVFIAVLGVENPAESRAFYQALGSEVTVPRPFAIRVLSAAHKLSKDTTYEISSACLSSAYRIEMDHYPPSAKRRSRRDGNLPPGMAMIGLEIDSLDTCVQTKNITTTPPGPPYYGARISRIEGPSGEWIELIESTGS